MDKFNPNNFRRIGTFSSFSKHEGPKYFDINIRKLKFKEEVVEILIKDITDIKLAEKIKIETKLLAKINHEFKTPLITIISLVNNIKQNQSDSTNQVNLNLEHINNLSTYTIMLINDITLYVSNSIDLKLKKIQIIVMDIIDFCYNILKTLLECNENKKEKRKIFKKIDDSFDNLLIFSDDKRLKQIIVNLISNSIKFTKSGYIKFEAKYVSQFYSVELSVEDTGIGIQEKDHHLIFQKKIQFNLEKDYNSGLDLSIIKNLADSLNHKINFHSKPGDGSTFFIINGKH